MIVLARINDGISVLTVDVIDLMVSVNYDVVIDKKKVVVHQSNRENIVDRGATTSVICFKMNNVFTKTETKTYKVDRNILKDNKNIVEIV